MNELEQLRAMRDACVERLGEINHDLIGREPESVGALALAVEKEIITQLLVKAGLMPTQQ